MNMRYFVAGICVGLYIKPRISKKLQEVLKAAVSEASITVVNQVLYPEGRRPRPDDTTEFANFKAFQRWQKENS